MDELDDNVAEGTNIDNNVELIDVVVVCSIGLHNCCIMTNK
jgi:hypothetical protein